MGKLVLFFVAIAVTAVLTRAFMGDEVEAREMDQQVITLTVGEYSKRVYAVFSCHKKKHMTEFVRVFIEDDSNHVATKKKMGELYNKGYCAGYVGKIKVLETHERHTIGSSDATSEGFIVKIDLHKKILFTFLMGVDIIQP